MKSPDPEDPTRSPEPPVWSAPDTEPAAPAASAGPPVPAEVLASGSTPTAGLDAISPPVAPAPVDAPEAPAIDVPALVAQARRRRAPAGLGTIIAVSVISATIASAGTVGVAGLLRPASGTSAPQASSSVTTVVAVPTPTPGESSTTNASADPQPVVAVAEQVSPAVVTITSESAPSQFDPFGGTATGVGSGFFITANGLILTNNHVIDGASQLTVKLTTGKEYAASVVTTDPTHDLAILKIEATGLPTVEIGSSADLQVGQMTVAIGSPLGTLTTTVTSGILSATDRTITVSDALTRRSVEMTGLLQTDAAINPGNSGGPLLDVDGRAIGINTAVSTSAEGIGFAVPIDTAKALIAKAEASYPAA